MIVTAALVALTSTSGGGLFSDEEIPDAVSPEAAAIEEPPSWIPRVTGHAELDVEVALDTSFDRRGEHIFELAIGGKFELDADIAQNLRAYVAPELTHLSALDREQADRALLYLDAPEAHLTWSPGGFHLRAGLIIFSWGSSDLIAPSDVLNPLDLRRTTFGSPDEAKIPILAAEGVVAFEPFTLRAVVAPVFTASRFHLTGWDAAIAPVAAANGLQFPDLDAILGKPTVDRVGDQIMVVERPSDRPDNATIGLRATAAFDTIDLSATFVHGFEPLPRISVDKDLLFIGGKFAESFVAGESIPIGDPEILAALGRVQTALEEGRDLLQGSYRRRTVIGGDVTWAVDPIVFKFDAAYTFERTFYNQQFQPLAQPWLNSVAGAEFVDGDRLQLLVEGFLWTVFDVRRLQTLILFEPRGPAPSDRPDARNVMLGGVAGVARYNVFEGELGFELGAIGTSRGDLILLPTIRWRPNDHHQLRLGGVAMEGRKDGYGGIYTNTDRVFVGWTWTP